MEIWSFCFIGYFSYPIKQKALREDAHLAEKKNFKSIWG